MSSNADAPPPPYPGIGYNAATYSQPGDFGFAQNDPSKGGTMPPPAYAPPQQYGTVPPPPPGYGQHHQHSTVVVSQPAVTLIQVYREAPVHTRCLHCQAEVITAIRYETGTFTWIICFVMWLVGCGLGCCLIPFCVDGCKDVIHSCPNCMQQIARYSRM